VELNEIIRVQTKHYSMFSNDAQARKLTQNFQKFYLNLNLEQHKLDFQDCRPIICKESTMNGPVGRLVPVSGFPLK